VQIRSGPGYFTAVETLIVSTYFFPRNLRLSFITPIIMFPLVAHYARKYCFVVVLCFFACGKPLAVSHLSPEGIALTKKKGYGRPSHNYFSRFICFDIKCRKKAAWVKSQKKNRFKGYKNPHGLPTYHDRRTIAKDTSIIAGLPVPTQPQQTAVTSAVKTDSVITLSAILFEKDDYHLKKESYPRLDSITRFLEHEPHLKVSVLGHTDNEGSEQHNLRLSERRAQAVAIYFADNGVADDRILFDGLGSSRPVADNATLAGRQKNRRVEIIIHNPQ
jgi:outer membrane protein OmpA-like peptidoglycan-associated protein